MVWYGLNKSMQRMPKQNTTVKNEGIAKGGRPSIRWTDESDEVLNIR
jgi:hypothetical protein